MRRKYKKYRDIRIVSQFFTWKDIFKWIVQRDTRMLKREWKYFWQRVFRGWDDSETWNLEMEIAEFIYPRLKRYFQITITAPPYDMEQSRHLTDDEWNLTKKKILFALNQTRLNGPNPHSIKEKDWKVVQGGWELFYKYRRSFWW